MGWPVNSTVKLVLGIIGNITALFLFLAPVPTMVRFFRQRSTESFSSAPYIATLLNCLLWTFYGTPFVDDGRILVLTINGFGVLAEACYLLTFLLFCSNLQRIRTGGFISLVVALFAVIAAITVAVFTTASKRSLFVGVIADLITIVMYASPLEIIRLVIATKSVEFMPFFLSLNSFLNAVAWTTYAIYVQDVFIGIPNGIGIGLGGAQLVIYAMYRNQGKGRKGISTLSSSSTRDSLGKSSSRESFPSEGSNI